MTRIGDIVATSSGRIYRVRHISESGRHFIEPWEGSAYAPGRKATWARAVTFVKSGELANVAVDVRLATMHEGAGDIERAVKRLDIAARSLVKARDRGVDTPADLTHARLSIEALAARLSTLDVPRA